MTKHTPGPWEVLRYFSDYTHSIGEKRQGGNEIANVIILDNGDKVADANANLITTAPDLLEVLQVIFNRVMYESPTAEIETVFDDEMIARVQGILNEAEGKS